MHTHLQWMSTAIKTSPRPGQRGLAISLILTAVALLAALALATVYSAKANFGWGNRPVSDSRAATILAQARNIRGGIDTMTARGTPISSITFDTSANTGLFNPSTGGTEQQIPLATSVTSSSAQWVWKVDSNGNPVVKLYNVGTANADYVVVLPYVEWNTCEQINTQLYNNDGNVYGINATLSALTAAATAVDLSAANSGTQGWEEGCYNTSDGYHVYLATIRPQ